MYTATVTRLNPECGYLTDAAYGDVYFWLNRSLDLGDDRTYENRLDLKGMTVTYDRIPGDSCRVTNVKLVSA